MRGSVLHVLYLTYSFVCNISGVGLCTLARVVGLYLLEQRCSEHFCHHRGLCPLVEYCHVALSASRPCMSRAAGIASSEVPMRNILHCLHFSLHLQGALAHIRVEMARPYQDMPIMQCVHLVCSHACALAMSAPWETDV